MDKIVVYGESNGTHRTSSSRHQLVCCVVRSSYVVVAPQIMRAGSAYDVIVTIFGATSSVTVNVRLHDSRNVSVATSSTTVGAGQRSVLFCASLI